LQDLFRAVDLRLAEVFCSQPPWTLR